MSRRGRPAEQWAHGPAARRDEGEDVPEHAQQPAIEAVEEASHEGCRAYQRGHSAAGPNGEWCFSQAMAEQEGSRASGKRERVRGWDGLACTAAQRKKRTRCAEISRDGNSRAFGADCARERGKVSAAETMEDAKGAEKGW